MSPKPERLVLASRGSKLAQRQTQIVAGLIAKHHPDIEVTISTVTTKGDRDQRAFSQIGGKGLFTTEVEREVVEGRAHAAVHSAKDLTAELGPGCAIVCIPERVSVHDVVIGGGEGDGRARLAALPEGARVGTSSMRRRALLLEARPDIEMVELRGNIDTRLRKVADGEADAAILAAAGIERLGSDVSMGLLDPEFWIPAPAQGALAVEALAEDMRILELFEPINDPVARAEVSAERAFAHELEGGCSVPLGCLARAEGTQLLVNGLLAWPDGSQVIRDRISGGLDEAAALGRELAQAIRQGGGDDILEEIRDTETPEVVEP